MQLDAHASCRVVVVVVSEAAIARVKEAYDAALDFATQYDDPLHRPIRLEEHPGDRYLLLIEYALARQDKGHCVVLPVWAGDGSPCDSLESLKEQYNQLPLHRLSQKYLTILGMGQ